MRTRKCILIVLCLFVIWCELFHLIGVIYSVALGLAASAAATPVIFTVFKRQ